MKHDIEGTAKLLGFTPKYIRFLIRKGTLSAPLEPIVPESLVQHHMISDEELARFNRTAKKLTRRNDGRNKYVVYMSLDERDKVRKVLTDNGLIEVVATLRNWNPLKPKTAKVPKIPKVRKHAKIIPRV